MPKEILWQGRISRKYFIGYYLLTILFLAGAAIIFFDFFGLPIPSPYGKYISYFLASFAIFPILVGEVKRILIKYTLTSDRLIKDVGIINKTVNAIPLEMMEKAICDLAWYERLLKVGDVEIDTGEEQIVVTGINHPKELEGRIHKLRDQLYKERRGRAGNL